MRQRLNLLASRRSKKVGLPPGTPVHIGEAIHAATSISVIDYDQSSAREQQFDGAEGLAAFKASPTPTWINIDSMQDLSILRRLGDDYGLHPLVLEDIVNTEQRPKLEDYRDYLYIVVKMLSYKGSAVMIEQVSVVLGPSYVISFQENGKPGDVFDPIRTRLRSGTGKIRMRGADFLAYSLLDAIVDHYFVILERLGEQVEQIEDDLLDHPGPETVQTIHRLRRETIFLRKSVWPLREVVSGLQRTDSPLVREGTQIYLRDIYDHTIQVIDSVETLRDILQGMLDIYLSSVSHRMNEIMKVLTIIATVFIPLTFIVGVYGMNFEYFPELKWPWAYPVLWAIMLGIAGFMLAFFKRKGWF
ncbi:MAG: magnesium/cobalt transporter CorA [Gammaproteobacteria bacterium]